jgi:hypothetical protein
MAVLAGNTHPLQNRVQCPHKAEYIILGNPGQLPRPAVASTSQLYLRGTLLQLLLGVSTSIHLWEIIRSSASLPAGLRQMRVFGQHRLLIPKG